MMTLHELDVLIRRIETALERPVADTALSRLASEYNSSARAAATRLNQCASMLAVGDEHQALQLAETQPALLDQLTLLSFRRSPQWRALCRTENLPAPESFDIKAIRHLNELYAKGIDKDHALYRDYRRAVMLNEDARALAILRSIVRLNPNDKNAKTEHDRLEHKLRADKIRQLEKLVHAGAKDADAILALADELEKSGAPTNSPAWFEAQTLRASHLLTRVASAKKSGAWEDFQRALEKLRPLISYLPAESRATFDELDRWADGEIVRRKEDADRRAAIDQLSSLAARIEQEQFTVRKHPLAEIRQAADSLERAWRQVEHFRADISSNLSTTVLRQRDELQSEIDRSQRASRRLAFAGVAAIVILCIAAAVVAYSRQAASALIDRVHVLVAERKVSEAEAALNALDQYSRGQAVVRQGRAFVQKERMLKTNFDEALATVENRARQNFTNASPEKINSEMVTAKGIVAQLAPEFRPPAETAFAKIESQWDQYLDRERTARTAKFLAIVTPIEAAANRDLQYNFDPQIVAREALTLKAHLDPALVYLRAPMPNLRPKQDAAFRLENLESRLDKFSRDATNFVYAQNVLNSAIDLTNYTAALQLLISSGFTPAPQRGAAATVAGQNLSAQNLLAPLLLPANPEALREPPHLPRYPNDVLPAEREIQRRLRDDENIAAISRLQIEVKSLAANDPRRHRTVFLRGALQRRITRRAGQFYDPVESPTSLQFVEKEFAPTDVNVEEPTPTPERELYDRTGLARLLDSNTGKYQASLLQVLDDINQDRQASPVFRAWLFARVCEMIDLQPAQWGSIWSPSFVKDRDELMRLGAKQIHSGDWFIPAANSQRAPALVPFFDRAAVHSYARESSFFKRLLPKAVESGVKIAGYVNVDGEPIFRTAGATSLWGLAASDQKPTLLYENMRHIVRALPFTPLFVFGGNATDLIDTTLQAAGYSANAVGLPETLPPILRAAP